MLNPYRSLLALLPDAPLQVGEVVLVDDLVSIELPGGGIAKARGDATVGDRVFFRDGVIEGPAPALTTVLIEV